MSPQVSFSFKTMNAGIKQHVKAVPIAVYADFCLMLTVCDSMMTQQNAEHLVC